MASTAATNFQRGSGHLHTKSPAIQMGDLIANTAKGVFADRLDNPKVALEDLKRICGRNLGWVAIWNEEYLRELREASIDAATHPSVALAGC